MPSGVSAINVSPGVPATGLSSISWYGPPSSAAVIAAVIGQINTYMTATVIGQIQGGAGTGGFDVRVGSTGGHVVVLRTDEATQRNLLAANLGYA